MESAKVLLIEGCFELWSPLRPLRNTTKALRTLFSAVNRMATLYGETTRG
jgi:hypothetical protein